MGEISESEKEREKASQVQSDPVFSSLAQRLAKCLEEGDLRAFSMYLLQTQAVLNTALVLARQLYGVGSASARC